MLPSFTSYMNYVSPGSCANALVFTLPCGGRLYFSYQTPVAFEKEGRLMVRQNSWGPTTGKHLNKIDGGNYKNRL